MQVATQEFTQANIVFFVQVAAVLLHGDHQYLQQVDNKVGCESDVRLVGESVSPVETRDRTVGVEQHQSKVNYCFQTQLLEEVAFGEDGLDQTVDRQDSAFQLLFG